MGNVGNLCAEFGKWFLLAPLAFGCGADDSLDALTGGSVADGEEVGVESGELVAATGQAIAVGAQHTCVILEGGSIKCWGYNLSGQLGLGNDEDRGDEPGEMGDSLPFVSLGAGKVVKALALSRTDSCAHFTNNQVKCWGAWSNGRLGQGDLAPRGIAPGTMGDNLIPIDVGTGRTVKAIASGEAHSCVILDTNQLKCWGQNFFGELGYGDTVTRGDDPGELGDNLPIVNLGAGRSATQIAVSNVATCVLLDNLSVKCWGRGQKGALGSGSTANLGDQPGEMQALVPLDFGAGLTVSKLFGGGTEDRFCALFTNNQIKCWGDNTLGALGLGDTNNRGDAPGEMGANLPFVNLGTNPTVKSVAVGVTHTCALLDLNETIAGQITTNQVKCWGENTTGQLGQGDVTARGDNPNEMGNALPLVPLGPGRSARAISAGYHSAAVLDNGQVKAWGNNNRGALGQGDLNFRGDGPNEMGADLPAIQLGTRSALAVTTGMGFNCARLPSGEVKCWGANGSGQLGLGDTANRGDQPGEMGVNLPAVALGTAKTAIAIDAGTNHACVVLTGGAVKCWGSNTRGKLGVGDTIGRGDNSGEMGDSLPTVPLGAGETAKAISVAADHSCALLNSSKIKCWGGNTRGELGLGDIADRGDAPGELDVMPAIDFGTRVPKALATGQNHNCAIFTSNEVACWGDGFRGAIGTGSSLVRGDQAGEMGSALLTVNLGTGLTAKGIAAGAHHSCAWLSNNQVKCWGANEAGQLGLGDNADRGDGPGEMGDALPAVPLGTGRTAKGVAVQHNNTCVLLDTNQIKCFGEGIGGAIGVGDEINRGDSPDEIGDYAPTVFFGAGRSVLSVSTGLTGCVLLDSKQVKCWGYNTSGQLGIGSLLRKGDQPGEMGDFLLPIDLGIEP